MISLSRRLWVTCVAFGIVGIAAAFGIIPIFADMLEIAKYVKKIIN